MKVLTLLLLLHLVHAKDCIFPIQIPYLQDVIVSHNATGVNPVATVVIRSQYPLVQFTWFVSKYGGDNRQSFPVKNGEDGMSNKQIKLRNNDVQISLQTAEPVEVRYATYIIDVGCTTLTGGFVLNRAAIYKAFTPVKVGKIVNAPQQTVIYESKKPFDVRFLVETVNEHQKVEYNVPAYRNGSEIVVQKRERLRPPFTALPLSTVAPRSENLHEVSARVSVPNEIKKFIIDVLISQSSFSGDDVVFYSWVMYECGFLTEETTDPIFTVKQCRFDLVEPSIDEDDVLVLPQEVGTMGCVYVIADGTPLPEMALAEISGNNVKRILHPSENTQSLVIMKVGNFQTKILNVGEISEYQLVVQSTQGFRHQRMRIESYVPVSVSVPDRSFTLSPRRLDLTCDVQGDFVSVGLYKSRQWSMEHDPSEWETITVTQTSRPGNYAFTLDLNEDLISQLNNQYRVVFCGVKTRFPTMISSSQYQFDLMPTSTAWY